MTSTSASILKHYNVTSRQSRGSSAPSLPELIKKLFQVFFHLYWVILHLSHGENPHPAFLPGSVLLQEEWKEHQKPPIVNNPPYIYVALKSGGFTVCTLYLYLHTDGGKKIYWLQILSFIAKAVTITQLHMISVKLQLCVSIWPYDHIWPLVWLINLYRPGNLHINKI